MKWSYKLTSQTVPQVQKIKKEILKTANRTNLHEFFSAAESDSRHFEAFVVKKKKTLETTNKH